MSLRMPQAPLSIEDLRLVRAVRETGSLSAAARALGLDHSTAFRRLGAAEARLGARLFLRARAGYAATAAGEEMAAAAARVLDDLEETARRLAGGDLTPTGVVRVTMPDTLVATVAPMLAAVAAVHPGLELETVSANGFLALTRREADAALRAADAPPEHLVGRRVATVATAPYVRRAHPAAAGGTAADAARDWIGLDESLAHLKGAGWLRRSVAAERIRLRANTLLGVQATVRAGAGAGLLPCFLGDADPDLVRLGPPLPDLATPLWLLTHPDLRRAARVRAVIDGLAARLGAMAGAFEGRSAGPGGGAPDGQAAAGSGT
jgi:DNA-binding transcriptional LysR family regulator